MTKLSLSDLLCATTRCSWSEFPETMWQWDASVYLPTEHDENPEPFGERVGHVSMYSFLDLDLDAADCESGDLEPILAAMVAADADGWLLENLLICPVPLLVIDRVTVEPEYRGRGYAALVEEKAIQSLAPFHSCAASVVTQQPEFRPAALRMADRLQFVPLPSDDDVRIRDLARRWEVDVMPG